MTAFRQRRKSVPVLLGRLDAIEWHGGLEDIHSGTLCWDTMRCDGGPAEPLGGGEAVWRSSQHDSEDASVFSPATIRIGLIGPNGPVSLPHGER